jgi:hypothetical protein
VCRILGSADEMVHAIGTGDSLGDLNERRVLAQQIERATCLLVERFQRGRRPTTRDVDGGAHTLNGCKLPLVVAPLRAHETPFGLRQASDPFHESAHAMSGRIYRRSHHSHPAARAIENTREPRHVTPFGHTYRAIR